MVHAAGVALAPIVVGSVALAWSATPPPSTVAWLVTLAGAFAATFTVSVMGGEVAPGANESARLQLIKLIWGSMRQFHPKPWMETAVSPLGRVSSTPTVSLSVVGMTPTLLTVMV